MDPVAELDIFWLVHFSYLSEGLCFAYFPTGCRLSSSCLAFLSRGLLDTAVEVPLLY